MNGHAATGQNEIILQQHKVIEAQKREIIRLGKLVDAYEQLKELHEKEIKFLKSGANMLNSVLMSDVSQAARMMQDFREAKNND